MLSNSRCVIDAVRRMRAYFVLIALFATFSAHGAATQGDIVVANVHGDVRVTMAGATSPLYVGAILQLPATIRTGNDGSLELRQGPTTVAAAANTELEIPQSAAEAGLIERIVQIRGNAFYNVGKRERTKLRVETPYLVAVIKGTQFNVAAQEDATTIALFEGRLEVRAADESDVIDLRAGEIAIRNRGEPTIRTLQMNSTARVPANNDATAASDAQAASPAIAATVIEPSRSVGASASSELASSAPIGGRDATATVEVADNAGASVDLDTRISVGTESGATAVAGGTTAIDVGASVGSTAVAIDTSASVGAVSVDVGASIGNSIDTSLSASVGPVGASVDTGVGAVNVDASVGANIGDVATTVSVGASPTTGIDAGLGVGNAADVSVNVDTGAGTTVSVDAGIGGIGGTVGATVDTGGTIAAGVDVGNLVDVDVDLGAGKIDVDVGGNDTGGGLVGGIVGGLLGGRKGK